MLAAVVGGVAAFVFYRQAGEEIRSRVESRLAQHYKGLKVSVRSAELVEGTGIRVRNLSILEPGAEGPCAELMTIEEMVLECPTEWQELIKGDPAVRPCHRSATDATHNASARRPMEFGKAFTAAAIWRSSARGRR